MNSIISLLFYLVIAAVSAVATYLAQKQNRKALLLFPVLLLSLVAGLRSLEVGVDTETYNALFYFTQRMNFSNVTREHLFYYTSVFVLSLFGTTAAVFTVFAFLINTLVFLRLWDFRYSAHLGVAVFLFVTFYFGGIMNGLRQYIAVAILFFATRYLKKRQYIRFLFMLVLAISFHNSAIVACLFPALYIFPQKAYTLKEVLILGITLICVPLSGMMFFHQYAGYYSDAKEAEFGLMGITRLTILLLTYLMFKNAIHVEITDISGFTDNSSFSFVFGICFIGFSLGLSSMIVEYASRMGYYFRIFELVYFGMIFHSSEVGRSLKVAFFAALTVLGTYFLWTYNGIIPYSTIFG